ncbi:MAG: ParB/RepB/Spo0J family partition protein [Planctomycetota bacterium]
MSNDTIKKTSDGGAPLVVKAPAVRKSVRRKTKLRPANLNEPNRMVKTQELLKRGGDALPAQGQRVVSLTKLVPDPDNERKGFDRETVEQMAESIRQIGIVEPITASPVGDGLFMILSGHTRFEAAKLAGLGEVEITLRNPESPAQRRRQSLISNVHRKDLSAVETAEALRRLMQDGSTENQVELAKSIGKSKQWVTDMMAVLELPDELRDRLAQLDHPVANDTVVRIARLAADPELQAELVGDVERGAKMSEVRGKIADRKQGGKGQATKAKAKGGDGGEAPATKPKNKIFIGRGYDADVIVQSKTTEPLTWDRQVDVLRAALRVAEENADEQIRSTSKAA